MFYKILLIEHYPRRWARKYLWGFKGKKLAFASFPKKENGNNLGVENSYLNFRVVN